jgi:hypothetical protein
MPHFSITHCNESLFLCIVLGLDNGTVGSKHAVNTSTL